MRTYEDDETADRAGVSTDELQGMVDAGIIRPDPEHRYRPGDVRRAELVSLTAAGITLEELSDASLGAEVVFRDIGPVELKGVAGALHLHAASLSG